MAYSLRQLWEDARPNLVWVALTAAALLMASAATTLASGLSWWQRLSIGFVVVVFLAWAIAATVLARSARSLLPRPTVTSRNVEAVILEWIRKFKFGNQPLADDPASCHFSYLITMPTGLGIVAMRPNALSGNYLTFSCTLNMTQEQIGRFERLMPGKLIFVRELRAECNKARVSVNIPSPLETPFQLRIDHLVPITGSLNEHEFLKTLQGVQQDTAIVAVHLDICLERAEEWESKARPSSDSSRGTEVLTPPQLT